MVRRSRKRSGVFKQREREPCDATDGLVSNALDPGANVFSDIFGHDLRPKRFVGKGRHAAIRPMYERDRAQSRPRNVSRIRRSCGDIRRQPYRRFRYGSTTVRALSSIRRADVFEGRKATGPNLESRHHNLAVKGNETMSDGPFVRDRQAFGRDAIGVLEGIKLILTSLEAAYAEFNNIPPIHHARLMKSLDLLIRSTQRELVDGQAFVDED